MPYRLAEDRREAYQRWRKTVRVRLWRWRAGPCERCDTYEGIRELAHLGPTKLNGRGRGQVRRYYDLIRHPMSYARFCLPCHRGFDRKEFTWERTTVPEWAGNN